MLETDLRPVFTKSPAGVAWEPIVGIKLAERAGIVGTAESLVAISSIKVVARFSIADVASIAVAATVLAKWREGGFTE
jgi:hypothetical protein